MNQIKLFGLDANCRDTIDRAGLRASRARPEFFWIPILWYGVPKLAAYYSLDEMLGEISVGEIKLLNTRTQVYYRDGEKHDLPRVSHTSNLTKECCVCKRPLPWRTESYRPGENKRVRWIRHKPDNTTETIRFYGDEDVVMCPDCRALGLTGLFVWPDGVEFPAAWYVERMTPHPNDTQLTEIYGLMLRIHALSKSPLITLDHAREAVSYLYYRPAPVRRRNLFGTEEENGSGYWITVDQVWCMLASNLASASSTLESNAIKYARFLEIMGARFKAKEWKKVCKLEIPATHAWYRTWNVVKLKEAQHET